MPRRRLASVTGRRANSFMRTASRLARCPCSQALPSGTTTWSSLFALLREVELPDTAAKLERGMELGTKVYALAITDREAILRALDETPSGGLAELRGVLLREHEWRVREGLV